MTSRGTPARVWRCGRHVLDLERPLVMGILNVTPDSFSDGGLYADRSAAIEHGMAMARAGAHIIDIGGESTRPGAHHVAPAEETSRVCTVIDALASELDIPLSVDTRHASVAEAALAAGASIINDISGFRDPEMVSLASGHDVGLVVMHMLGDPTTMQQSPAYGDVVAEVTEYLAGQAARLETAGVSAQRIALDPGIGFGKTTEHNLELLRGLSEIAALGHPLLVGVSRKRFIGELTGQATPADRAFGSVAAAVWAIEQGADIVRVHDVQPTIEALTVWQALEGVRP